jgi:hypothetical protein
VAAAIGLGVVAGCTEVVPDAPEPSGSPEPTVAPEPTLERAGTVPAGAGGGYGVVDGVLAVAEPEPGDEQRWRVAGYRLPDGEQLWTASLGETDSEPQVTAAPGRFIVGYQADRTSHTAVVAPSDGAISWQHAGVPVAVVAPTGAEGEDLLVITATAEFEEEEVEPGRIQVNRVDYEYAARPADTGEPAWSLTGSAAATPDLNYLLTSSPPVLPPTTRFAAAGRLLPGQPFAPASWLVLVDDEDAPGVVDPATGQQRPLGPGEPAAQGGVHLAGDLALVSYAEQDPAAVDLATGAQRWTLTELGLGFGAAVDDCGPVICVSTFEGRGADEYDTHGVDRETGDVLWTHRNARRVAPALPGRPGSPLLALSTRIDEAEDVEMGVARHDEYATVLAPETGEVLLDLAEWKPFGADGSWLLVYADPDNADQPDDDQRVVGDLEIAVVDLDEAEIHPVGTVPDVLVYRAGSVPGWRLPQETYLGCRAASGWVSCQHADGEVSVWRYRAES